MNLTILGASGATGHELTRQALERGHNVTVVVRDPKKITVPDSQRLRRVTADVRNPQSIAKALAGSTTILSALGIAKGDKPGVLTAGARASVEAQPTHIVWLGAFGTGRSAAIAGTLTRILLRMFLGAQLEDKITADTHVLNAGGTVFHPGPLSNRPLSPTRRTLPLERVPRRIFPASVSRATVAAAMLDAAEKPYYAGQILVPLEH